MRDQETSDPHKKSDCRWEFWWPEGVAEGAWVDAVCALCCEHPLNPSLRAKRSRLSACQGIASTPSTNPATTLTSIRFLPIETPA